MSQVHNSNPYSSGLLTTEGKASGLSNTGRYPEHSNNYQQYNSIHHVSIRFWARGRLGKDTTVQPNNADAALSLEQWQGKLWSGGMYI